MLRITRARVLRWARAYDKNYRGEDRTTERQLKRWLRNQPPPKHLDKEHFVRLARWKSKRPTPLYRSNPAALVSRATTEADSASDELEKLRTLTVLEGVGMPVASTILHFLHPRRFPIYDERARNTLVRANKWQGRGGKETGLAVWKDYVEVMRQLSERLGVSLRQLDKALYAYDKWCRWC